MVTDARLDVGAPGDPPVDPERAPYEHALADAEFRARVGRRYRGGHDLLDALWWLDHPRDPGPSGAPAPSTLLAVARETLYAPAPAADALGRYAEAEGRERVDRESLEAAVLAADPHDARVPSAALDPVRPGPTPTSGSIPTAEPRSTARMPAWLTAGRWRWVTAGTSAVLALVALVGWTRPAPAAAPPREGTVVEVRTGTKEALDRFWAPAPAMSRVMTSRLAVVGRTTVTAQLTDGLICMEARTRTRATSACRTLREFWFGGLELPSVPDSSSLDRVRWLSDGRLLLWTLR